MTVVNMFEKKKELEEKTDEVKASPTASEGSFDFAAIMKRNRENAQRLETDKAKANKGVIRSYRLKH